MTREVEGAGPASVRIGNAWTARVQAAAAVIVYTPQEWQAFIEGVKDGEFDFA